MGTFDLSTGFRFRLRALIQKVEVGSIKVYQRLSNKQAVLSQWFQSLPMTAKGIFLALFSTALFTLVGALVRQLSADYDAFQILFFRQLVFVLLLAPAMRNNMKVLLKRLRLGFIFFAYLERLQRFIWVLSLSVISPSQTRRLSGFYKSFLSRSLLV